MLNIFKIDLTAVSLDFIDELSGTDIAQANYKQLIETVQNELLITLKKKFSITFEIVVELFMKAMDIDDGKDGKDGEASKFADQGVEDKRQVLQSILKDYLFLEKN